MIGDKVMKKIILLIILILIITTGCSLIFGDLWEEAKREREEKGEKCYRDYKGYFYCEDRDGNRYQPTKFPEGIRNYGEQENGCLNVESLSFSRHNEYSEDKKFCQLVAGA